MEGLWEYLFIAAIVGFGIFGEIRKQKAKKAGQDLSMPTPAVKPIEVSTSKPKSKQSESVASLKARKEREAKEQLKRDRDKAIDRACSPPETSGPTTNNQPIDDNDFTINNVEEARKAIIWSEILQRKY